MRNRIYMLEMNEELGDRFKELQESFGNNEAIVSTKIDSKNNKFIIETQIQESKKQILLG